MCEIGQFYHARRCHMLGACHCIDESLGTAGILPSRAGGTRAIVAGGTTGLRLRVRIVKAVLMKPGARMRSGRTLTHAAKTAVFDKTLKTANRLAGGRHVFVTSYPATPAPRWGWDRPTNGAIESVLQPDRERFEAARETIGPYGEFLATIPVHGDHNSLHWDNNFWGALDAAFLCASLIERAPAHYVEVGSGYSTMFARHVIETFGLSTTITSIDPTPRAQIDGLCDRVVRQPLQDAPLELFTSLGAGDVVLFDGSHEAYMAADTIVMLLEILPILSPGVLFGFDDVFLPWDYPATWSDRFYGEQYLLASYLLGGGCGSRVVLPAFYLTRGDNDHHRFDSWVPHMGSFGKSFWLERS